MIDLHTHIIPGVDDGPQSFEDALAMLRLSAESGVTDIVATPHANERYAYDPHTVTELTAHLQSQVSSPIRIHRGCELNLTFENAERALSQPQSYTLASTSYLLVELPEVFVPSSVDRILLDMLNSGLWPIIAHPERNRMVREDLPRLREWVEAGIYLQLTSQSILGEFGSSAKRASEKILRLALCHVIASDTHDTVHRPPGLDECRRHILSTYGQDAAERLLTLNPQRVLQNERIEERSAPVEDGLLARLKRRVSSLVS